MSFVAHAGDRQPATYQWHDVRFIGPLAGRYALPDRREETGGKLPVYACRLRSISTRVLVALGPVPGQKDEEVCCHFDDFGLLKGRVSRRMSAGFAIRLNLSGADRDKLGSRIEWRKKQVLTRAPDKREHKRIQPRDPRSTIVLADGTAIPCFVIDVSQSGAAISAHLWPRIGTPMALGRMVGRVVRHLEVGFALQFTAVHPLEDLEQLLQPPADSKSG
jgi:hypothetical protein